jgi:hypothetical protein
MLTVLFQQFLAEPTGELYSGLATGMYAFLRLLAVWCG